MSRPPAAERGESAERLSSTGASGSRNLEEGYSEERALDQIAEFLDMAADHAEANEITIVIEPICHREGNVLRTVADGLEMAQRGQPRRDSTVGGGSLPCLAGGRTDAGYNLCSGMVGACPHR